MDSDFVPMLWREDKLPVAAAEYAKCEICTPKSQVIWGEGNPAAPIVIILDNPGAHADTQGNPYVCGTRQTLQYALHRAGFAAEDIYLAYLLKCRPLRQYNKSAVRAFSKPFLAHQIQTMQPQYIMCLGDVVVQTLFGGEDAQVKELRGTWHHVLGYPCLVSYHPLAVRRRPNLMPYFMADWDMLAHALRRNDTDAP